MARPRIVIVGAGFGGLSAAHGLAGAPADVTVIDRRNYHLFQPLLYQVAIAGLAHIALRRDFRVINPREARIVLVEAGPRVLASFPAVLSESAQRSLERLHVEVRLGKPVSHCDETGVTIGEEHLPAATIIW